MLRFLLEIGNKSGLAVKNRTDSRKGKKSGLSFTDILIKTESKSLMKKGDFLKTDYRTDVEGKGLFQEAIFVDETNSLYVLTADGKFKDGIKTKKEIGKFVWGKKVENINLAAAPILKANLFKSTERIENNIFKPQNDDFEKRCRTAKSFKSKTFIGLDVKSTHLPVAFYYSGKRKILKSLDNKSVKDGNRELRTTVKGDVSDNIFDAVGEEKKTSGGKDHLYDLEIANKKNLKFSDETDLKMDIQTKKLIAGRKIPKYKNANVKVFVKNRNYLQSRIFEVNIDGDKRSDFPVFKSVLKSADDIKNENTKVQLSLIKGKSKALVEATDEGLKRINSDLKDKDGTVRSAFQKRFSETIPAFESGKRNSLESEKEIYLKKGIETKKEISSENGVYTEELSEPKRMLKIRDAFVESLAGNEGVLRDNSDIGNKIEKITKIEDGNYIKNPVFEHSRVENLSKKPLGKSKKGSFEVFLKNKKEKVKGRATSSEKTSYQRKDAELKLTLKNFKLVEQKFETDLNRQIREGHLELHRRENHQEIRSSELSLSSQKYEGNRLGFSYLNNGYSEDSSSGHNSFHRNSGSGSDSTSNDTEKFILSAHFEDLRVKAKMVKRFITVTIEMPQAIFNFSDLRQEIRDILRTSNITGLKVRIKNKEKEIYSETVFSEDVKETSSLELRV